MIKTGLRGSGRRLRATSPDQAEQEAWGLLIIHNALVDQAVTAAVDLDTETTTISHTAVLAALRDHLTPQRWTHCWPVRTGHASSASATMPYSLSRCRPGCGSPN
jgi:hypothetical protein